MNKQSPSQVTINNKSIVLTDSDFVASGGEGGIWKMNIDGKIRAIKVMHSSKLMPDVAKLKELGVLDPRYVAIPLDLVYDN